MPLTDTQGFEPTITRSTDQATLTIVHVHEFDKPVAATEFVLYPQTSYDILFSQNGNKVAVYQLVSE